MEAQADLMCKIFAFLPLTAPYYVTLHIMYAWDTYLLGAVAHHSPLPSSAFACNVGEHLLVALAVIPCERSAQRWSFKARLKTAIFESAILAGYSCSP